MLRQQPVRSVDRSRIGALYKPVAERGPRLGVLNSDDADPLVDDLV